MKKTKNSFLYWSKTVNSFEGKPHGIIWLTACFMFSNYRIFPVGYKK